MFDGRVDGLLLLFDTEHGTFNCLSGRCISGDVFSALGSVMFQTHQLLKNWTSGFSTVFSGVKMNPK